MELHWEAYLKQGGAPNDQIAFGVWLIRNSPEAIALPEPVETANKMDETAIAGMLIGRLERFLHVAAKPLFKAAGLQNPDDFPVLAILFFGGQLPKGHLLKQALIEPATGSEMLKRMKASGWLIETPHPEDGRSGIIALTNTGRELVMSCFKSLDGLDDVLNCLDAEERKTLLTLLNKLDAFHSHRHGIKQVQDWMGEQ